MVTKFQQRVYDALKLIPKGRVTTYKALGRFIGCRSAQAIGQALTRNPDHPHVPCHRVICSNGNIGGYVLGTAQKRSLLQQEGIEFSERNGEYFLVNKAQLWDFSKIYRMLEQ